MLWIIQLLLGVALACDGDTDARVVGWKADGSIVVRTLDTMGSESELWLATYAPGEDEPARRWTIQATGDSQATRGANWKAAEGELLASGYTIVPDAEPTTLASLSDPPFYLTRGAIRDDDSRITHTYVFASQGERTEILQPAIEGCCWGGNRAATVGPWNPPGTDWIVYLGTGCGGSGRVIWHDLARARKALP